MRDRKAEYAANKDAVKARSSEWYYANQDRARARSHAYYHANKAQARSRELMKKYGLTLEAYDEMLAGQGGTCSTCPATSADRRGGALHVDHCHETGRVRGLLCTACNNALGLVNDDPERLRRLATYLTRSSIAANSCL